MNFTDEDKRILAEMLKNKDGMKLLYEALTQAETKFTPQLVTNMSEEELGKLVKIDMLAEEKVKTRFDNLKRMAVELSARSSPVAPK